jgi:primary-amine oxidase
MMIATLVGMSNSQGSETSSDHSARHPLDPLTATEYSTVIAVLRESNKVADNSRYPLIVLREPAKDRVLQWQEGQPLARQAFVIVKKGPRTFEAIVDISMRKVTSWEFVAGVQPGI